MNDKEVSAKDLYDYLMDMNDQSPSLKRSEERFAWINSFCISKKESERLRKCARLLSINKNMPFAFWSNASGGAHCGFFLYRSESFKEIHEYIDDADNFKVEEVDLKQSLKRIFYLLSEVDPEEEYSFYKL